MKKIRFTRYHLFGIVGAILVLVIAALGVLLFQLDQTRIGNLHSLVTASRAETASTRTADQKAYQSLLDKYTKVYAELANTGATTTAPNPSTIVGLPGPKGDPGASASFADIFTAVQDYCDLGPETCKGDPGVAGTNGTDGATGAAGAPGAAGAVGPQGPAGNDGQPPVSWTYTDMLGGTHDCTRTDPFDASAPTYQCT